MYDSNNSLYNIDFNTANSHLTTILFKASGLTTNDKIS